MLLNVCGDVSNSAKVLAGLKMATVKNPRWPPLQIVFVLLRSFPLFFIKWLNFVPRKWLDVFVECLVVHHR